jgi:hypothetical protein
VGTRLATKFTASEIQTMGKLYDCPYDARNVTWSTTVLERVAMKQERHTEKIVCSIKKNVRSDEKRKPSK